MSLPDHRLCACLAALLCEALYLRTMAPSAMWYDMAELPTAAYFLSIAHETGYPLYLLLGKLFTLVPLADVAYRVNLMSSVFAALTVLLVFLTVWDLTHRRSAATVAALTLGVSSALWANATLAESYALNAFFTALLTYLMLAWQRSLRRVPLFAAFYLLGLAMGNHHLIQLFGLAMLVYWAGGSWQGTRRLPWRELPLLALFFVLGFAINLYLPIRAAHKPTMMWADASQPAVFWRMITVGQFQKGLLYLFAQSPATLWKRLHDLLLFPFYEFTIPGVGLALWGAGRLWRDKRVFLLYAGVGSGLTLSVIFTYGIHNIFQYYLPLYVMASICLGVGISALIEHCVYWLDRRSEARAVSHVVTLVSLLAGPILLGLPLYLVVRDFPVLDRSGDDSSFLFANYLSGRLEKGSRVLGDFWTWTSLAYYQTFASWRDDLLVYGTLSSQGIDWGQFIAALRAEGDTIYVAAGGPIPPGLSASALLHPAGIHVIETVTDYGIPPPWRKDLWLPLGDVYRIVNSPPSLVVDGVPSSWRIEELRFGDELSLVGFREPQVPLYIGATPKLAYYWVLNKPTHHDYYVQVRLEDSGGSVQLLRGMPIWDHSHLIGGLTPTSTWQPNVIMCERYDALIPWRVKPGRYAVKAWVYESREGMHLVPAADPADDEKGLTLGHIDVLPRRGPFDVRLQEAPRE